MRHLPDFQGTRVYPHCSWGLPSGFETSKYFGMLLQLLFVTKKIVVWFSPSFPGFFFWLNKIFYLQVDPLTHQVKLCDFGSAKVLVW